MSQQPDPASWILQVRHQLASPAPRRLTPGEGRQAAVLVPLFVDAGELWTLLTRRTESLPTHKSQIAFPGGGTEPGETPWQTALRETEEELGLDPKKILPLGELDELATPSGYRIIPCAGVLPVPFETRINPDEIAEDFRVPLSAFAHPRMVEDRRVSIDGVERTIRVYHVGSRQIWGLTARILQLLLSRLGLEMVEEG